MKMITKIEPVASNLEPRKKQVAAYCRVSTDMDVQLSSLEAQKAHYEEYIKSRTDWEFAGIYYDEGVTGTKKDKRPALMQMMRDCEDGYIDHIITKSISRFSRNTADSIELVRKLNELNVTIYFEKENLDSGTMESELLLSILAALAENESSSISQNARWSIRTRYAEGRFKLAFPPYGYDYLGNGEWKINEAKAKWVRFIYAEYINDVSCSKIADALNKKKVPTEKGKKWDDEKVRYVLKNEKYTGDCLLQKFYSDDQFKRHRNYGEENKYYVSNHHEAIISHEEFDAAQRLLKQRALAKNSSGDNSKYSRRYATTGKVICGACGSRCKRLMRYKPDFSYTMFTCGLHIKDKTKCSLKPVKETDVLDAFTAVMNKLIPRYEEVLIPIQEALAPELDEKNVVKLNELDAELKEFGRLQDILNTLVTGKCLDPGTYTKEVSKLSRKITGALTMADGIKNRALRASDENRELIKLMDFCKEGHILESFDKDCFESFIEKAEINGPHSFTFKFKCGLSINEDTE